MTPSDQPSSSANSAGANSAGANSAGSSVIPGLRYRNALPMIEWLCQAFGFQKQAVFADDQGVVAHAQLTLGRGMIMIGSVANGSANGLLLKQPDEIDGAETQTPYLVVADCDAVYATAKAAGAEMIDDLIEQDYGGKGFSCRDPEGHIWSVGSYDPWNNV